MKANIVGMEAQFFVIDGLDVITKELQGQFRSKDATLVLVILVSENEVIIACTFTLAR